MVTGMIMGYFSLYLCLNKQAKKMNGSVWIHIRNTLMRQYKGVPTTFGLKIITGLSLLPLRGGAVNIYLPDKVELGTSRQ